jgi:hypothetical protein
VENRLKERRARKSLTDWTRETEEKMLFWESLSNHERSLIRTTAMNELCDIVELGLERTKLKLQNR